MAPLINTVLSGVFYLTDEAFYVNIKTETLYLGGKIMKKIFKITSPGFLPIRISVETDDEKAVKTITQNIETWLAKLTKQLFPESYGSIQEIESVQLDVAINDEPTVKEIGGSLDSFPTPTDDTTDSSGTWMGLTARHWLVTSGNFIL